MSDRERLAQVLAVRNRDTRPWDEMPRIARDGYLFDIDAILREFRTIALEGAKQETRDPRARVDWVGAAVIAGMIMGHRGSTVQIPIEGKTSDKDAAA